MDAVNACIRPCTSLYVWAMDAVNSQRIAEHVRHAMHYMDGSFGFDTSRLWFISGAFSGFCLTSGSRLWRAFDCRKEPACLLFTMARGFLSSTKTTHRLGACCCRPASSTSLLWPSRYSWASLAWRLFCGGLARTGVAYALWTQRTSGVFAALPFCPVPPATTSPLPTSASRAWTSFCP